MAQPTEFFITLPSNTREEGNTTSEFRAQLPHPIELEGQWSVGLAEIQYPVSYNTVSDCGFTIFKELEGRIHFKVNDGYYETVEELVNALNYTSFQYGLFRQKYLNQWITEKREKLKGHTKLLASFDAEIRNLVKAVQFEYVPILKRIKVTLNPDWVRYIELDPRLQHTIGMKDSKITEKETLAKYPVDLKAGMDSMFLYCSLITPQLVGDTRTNLLKVIPLKGKFGEVIDIDFPNIHYSDLLTNRFSSVELAIKGPDGEPIKFNYGKIYVKLHLRKKRLF